MGTTVKIGGDARRLEIGRRLAAVLRQEYLFILPKFPYLTLSKLHTNDV